MDATDRIALNATLERLQAKLAELFPEYRDNSLPQERPDRVIIIVGALEDHPGLRELLSGERGVLVFDHHEAVDQGIALESMLPLDLSSLPEISAMMAQKNALDRERAQETCVLSLQPMMTEDLGDFFEKTARGSQRILAPWDTPHFPRPTKRNKRDHRFSRSQLR